MLGQPLQPPIDVNCKHYFRNMQVFFYFFNNFEHKTP